MATSRSGNASPRCLMTLFGSSSSSVAAWLAVDMNVRRGA
ncbi:hypothetical protein PI125_g12644 [Phytophthora idaei]|nr:hypothetical protein PI125_g12644 [Phytophthora idaei]